jgi:hypothetical protein
MTFYRRSNFMGNRSIARHSTLISMNLVMIAAFLAAPVTGVLIPVAPSLAATAPFPIPIPYWIRQLVRHLASGYLTQDDLATLKDKVGGSSKKLGYYLDRINNWAASMKIQYSLDGTRDGDVLKIVVFKDGQRVNVYTLGPAN